MSYIGEGTLGEGVLYEAMNLAALFKLPHLIVCENNLYSQSTPQSVGIAGDIAARPRSFGLRVFEADTWHVESLLETARQAIAHVREQREPAFLIIKTYRLNAHSKGDDDRSRDEVAFFHTHDPLNKLLEDPRWAAVNAGIVAEIDTHVVETPKVVMPLQEYLRDQLPRKVSTRLLPVAYRKVRMVQALNQAYRKTLDEGAIHIGEDIHDPYGGAFKVSKGWMDAHPESVFTTSISEAGLVGLATGAALMGTPAWAEIMFGDFMTNVFDQIVNNLAKIHHMYAFQASAPVRIRTPMGGKRGYGPTHSQSLEKLLVGIDNVATLYLTSLVDPGPTVAEVTAFAGPALVLENKVDYGKFIWECPDDLELLREARPVGSLQIRPRNAAATLTVVAYGETARDLAEHLRTLFIETDLVPELIVLQMIHPLDIKLIERSVDRTHRLAVVEDGSSAFGIGGEIIARLAERKAPMLRVLRIGAEPVPIPSITSLELSVLPTAVRVIEQLLKSDLIESAS